jgi:hypothetical protein
VFFERVKEQVETATARLIDQGRREIATHSG